MSATKPTLAQCNAFLAQELLPGVAFRHNEFVRIIAGTHKGFAGSLVSIEGLGDDPAFLIELELGLDAVVHQSEIARVQLTV